MKKIITTIILTINSLVFFGQNQIDCAIEQFNITENFSGFPTYETLTGAGFENTVRMKKKVRISANSSSIVEVRASLVGFDYNYNRDACETCLPNPISFGTLKASNLGPVPSANSIPGSFGTMGGTQNIREVIWRNNPIAPFGLISGLEAELEIYFPSGNSLPCCVQSISYCIKYTIVDINCNTCEKLVCGTYLNKEDCCLGYECCNPFTGFTYDATNSQSRFISPNGDGQNDFWYPLDDNNPNDDCAYNAKGYEIKVFNRWGSIVYERRVLHKECCPFKYPRDESVLVGASTNDYMFWDGVSNKTTFREIMWGLFRVQTSQAGQGVPSGTYWVRWKLLGCGREFEFPHQPYLQIQR